MSLSNDLQCVLNCFANAQDMEAKAKLATVVRSLTARYLDEGLGKERVAPANKLVDGYFTSAEIKTIKELGKLQACKLLRGRLGGLMEAKRYVEEHGEAYLAIYRFNNPNY